MGEFREVGRAEDVPPGGKLIAEVDGRGVAVFNVDGALYAIDDVCTHDGGPLAEGEFSGCLVECPRHGAKFDVRTGKAVGFPAFEPVASLPLEIREGLIFVDVDP